MLLFNKHCLPKIKLCTVVFDKHFPWKNSRVWYLLTSVVCQKNHALLKNNMDFDAFRQAFLTKTSHLWDLLTHCKSQKKAVRYVGDKHCQPKNDRYGTCWQAFSAKRQSFIVVVDYHCQPKASCLWYFLASSVRQKPVIYGTCWEDFQPEMDQLWYLLINIASKKNSRRYLLTSIANQKAVIYGNFQSKMAARYGTWLLALTVRNDRQAMLVLIDKAWLASQVKYSSEESFFCVSLTSIRIFMIIGISQNYF